MKKLSQALVVWIGACAYASTTVPSAYNTVNSGGALAKRSTLTFSGAITCVDNAGTLSTDCTVATGAGGVSSLNTLTGALTLAVGTAGTNFAVTPSGSTITFNLPDASATARGVITTGSQTIAGNKTFSGTTVVGTLQSTGTMTIQSAIAAGTSGTAMSMVFSNTKTTTSGTNTVLSTGINFAPTSGTGNGIAIRISNTHNQTGTATGQITGLQFGGSFTSVYNFRHIDTVAGSIPLLSTAPDQTQIFFAGLTYTAASSKTVTNIATLRLDGPIAGTNVTITNPYALWVDSGNSQFDGTVTSNIYTRVPPVAVGSLQTCNAAAAGARATVNDALAPVALATVAAGGAVTVGVLCDGTNWIVN